MQNKTLKDVLIDLYHSGDLVPVWDEDDKGRFVADLKEPDINWRARSSIAHWYLHNDPDIVSDAIGDKGPEIAAMTAPGIGEMALREIYKIAWSQTYESYDWDAAKADITERENSR